MEECRYYVILSKDLGYIDEQTYQKLYNALEKASWFLNSYAKGIVCNSAITKQS